MMDDSFCAHGYTISGHYPCCPWKSACVGVLLVFIQFLVYSLYLGTVHATHILTVLLFGSARTYIPHSQLCHCIKLQCSTQSTPFTTYRFLPGYEGNSGRMQTVMAPVQGSGTVLSHAPKLQRNAHPKGLCIHAASW